jgi:hypothetical protein
MRKALNDNPMVQFAVLGIAAVIFAFILFTSVLKKDNTAAAPDGTATPAASGTASPTSSSDAAPSTSTPSSSAAPATSSPAPSTASGASGAPAGGTPADGLLPSKGLPADLLVAFARNETIALLVVDPKGLSDKKVKQFTETLRSRNDVQVFVVDVKDIAKYARVTSGVQVSRTPALVVVKPRKLTASVPTASVSYGFRGPRSVNQAIDDALYKGKQVPSYP